MADETYLGPMSLREALNAGSEGHSPSGVAESVPDGSFVAYIVWGAQDEVRIRRKARQSGQGASVVGTGEWIEEAKLPPNIAWRPL